MSTASSIRSDLLRLIREHGREVVISRHSPLSSYNTSTGTVALSTDDDEFEGWARVGAYSERMLLNKQVEVGDRRVTFIPEEVDYVEPLYKPQIGDVIFLDASTDGGFKIISYQTRELAGELICYTLQVRNAGE